MTIAITLLALQVPLGIIVGRYLRESVGTWIDETPDQDCA